MYAASGVTSTCEHLPKVVLDLLDSVSWDVLCQVIRLPLVQGAVQDATQWLQRNTNLDIVERFLPLAVLTSSKMVSGEKA